jgi:hypothetical protein
MPTWTSPSEPTPQRPDSRERRKRAERAIAHRLVTAGFAIGAGWRHDRGCVLEWGRWVRDRGVGRIILTPSLSIRPTKRGFGPQSGRRVWRRPRLTGSPATARFTPPRRSSLPRWTASRRRFIEPWRLSRDNTASRMRRRRGVSLCVTEIGVAHGVALWRHQPELRAYGAPGYCLNSAGNLGERCLGDAVRRGGTCHHRGLSRVVGCGDGYVGGSSDAWAVHIYSPWSINPDVHRADRHRVNPLPLPRIRAASMGTL